MVFQFDSVLAEKYGVNESIFIHNIFYWINHNKANQKHYYEDRFWTYNTKKAFIKLFPFWTYEQVRKITKKLTDAGVLLTSNFNENSWDKTTWYSLSDEIVIYYENLLSPNKNACVKKHTSKCEKTHIELGKNTHRSVEKHTSNIGTDNKTQIIKPNSETSLTFFKTNFPSAYERFLMNYKSKIKDFQKFEKVLELKLEEEETKYEQRVINARIERFAINYITNEREVKVIAFGNQNNQPQKQAYQDKTF
jgi:hypothetical protein